MIVLFVWLSFLALQGGWSYYFGRDESFLNQIRNKGFPALLLLFGICHVSKLIDVSAFYLLSNSFERIGLTGQIGQCFILMPLLILFAQSNEKFSKEDSVLGHNHTTFLLAIGSTFALSSYNINIIFVMFVICEFFFIERENKRLRKLRGEIAVLLLVIFPFVVVSKELFTEIFFFLLIVLNIFDIYSFARDKINNINCQLRNLILVFPLRMTLLAYYASSSIAEEYISLGKAIFLLLLIISFFYGLIFRFNFRSRLVITQALLLASSLSVLAQAYMVFYFLLGLLLIYSVNSPLWKKSMPWPLIGPTLVFLSPFIDRGLGLISLLTSAFTSDVHSKIMGIALVLYLSVLVFQWGKELRGNQTFSMGIREKYYVLILNGSLVLNALYNPVETFPLVDWTIKIIISFYFIIILLLSYVVKPPKVYFKKTVYYVSKMHKVIETRGEMVLPLEIIEKALRLFLEKLSWLVSFLQEIAVNFSFVLVDLYEHKSIKKYQHLAMFLLGTFLFLWAKVFMVAR